MDYLDLDSFRSRYSDITVTAVPAKPKIVEEQETLPDRWDAVDGGGAEVMPADRVEIFPINKPGAPSNPMVMQHQQQQQHHQHLEEQQLKLSQEAAVYSNEYKQVLAKLEYTKYVQAQLQLISNNGFGELFYGQPGNQIQVPSKERSNTANSGNIVDTYDNLLSVIAEMQSNLGPAAIGLRAPKERLLRDIAHARVLVRECNLMLMRDHHHQQSHRLPSDD
ncbi:hypothetical protein AWZ03_011341 [Drosophila navojoa]|uniref:Uncharacterized protein n=1 Tax=Drosophila navojoa TaxID=7232 RepID=A0A484B1T4_DRONA|nr:uncharacterized protein LOC108658651 [Drosophila navojoa]TDG42232.1 hypothetical protein AWZ03_011341 [Drosophila navojoa]